MADPKIMCRKCGSYIHDTDHCWNWHERIWCSTYKQYKESCDCNGCKLHMICKHCNNWRIHCYCADERCQICNERLLYNNNGNIKCRWDHNEPLCQFCKLPFRFYGLCCLNNHSGLYRLNDHSDIHSLCKVCNMQELYDNYHKHDGTLCKNCRTLLNHGKCIYQCVNGGKRCIHCYYEGVVNNVCRDCNKDQSGQLTKAAIK